MNNVLLNRGAYSKFIKSDTTVNSHIMLNQLLTTIKNCEVFNQDNLKQIIETWNEFLQKEFPDDYDKYGIEIVYSDKLNTNSKVDLSKWNNLLTQDEQILSYQKRIKKAVTAVSEAEKLIYTQGK